MSRAKLNFRGLSMTEKLSRAKLIVAALTGNANFPNPTPTLADVTAVITQGDTKLGERDAAQLLARQKTSELNGVEDMLDSVMSKIAAHVDSVAAGDEAKIHSAGFDTRARATSTTEPPTPPTGLDSTIGDHEGELDAAWDTVAGAKSNVIEISEETPNAWKHAGVSTRSKFTLSGLVSGKRYWIRVAAINSVGQSGWSDPCTKIAP